MGRHKQINGQFVPAGLAVRHDILKMIYQTSSVSIRLPSALQLAKKHHVSRTTVTNELKKLTESGWIIGKPGIGSFSNPHQPLSCGHVPEKRIIGMLLGDTWHLMSTYIDWTVFSYAGMELLPDIGHPKTVTLFSEDAEHAHQELVSSTLDGMIWIFPPENYAKVIQRLHKEGKPVVTLYTQISGVPCIKFDREKIGADIADLLMKEGIGKVFWFTIENLNIEQVLKSAEFFWKKHAGKSPKIVVFDKRYNCLGKLEEFFKNGEIPDALFIHEGDYLVGIRDLMKKYSLSDRILLVTAWSLVRKDKDFRGIVYKNDFQKMGTLAAEYMKKLLDGERDQVPLLTSLPSEVMRFPV